MGYQLLAPAAQKVISQRTWVLVHQGCKGATGLAYKVTRPVIAGATAVVNVSLAGVASTLGSEEQSFTYAGGRWLFLPSTLSVYRHHTVAQVLAELKAAGLCS